MTKPSKPHRIKAYLFGLCFFLTFSISEYPSPPITENAHASTKAPFADALSWLRGIGQRMGLSSLEFEIHGVSLQVSKIVEHLGQFLPPAVSNWRPQGEMIFDLAVTEAPSHESGGTILSLDLHVKDVAFSSPDGTNRGNGLEGKIHVILSVPGQLNHPADLRADVDFERGKIVFGHFSFDLERDPLRLRFLGAYDHRRHRFSSLSVHFHVPSLGQGTITTALESLEDLRGEAKVTLGPIPNKQAFDLFVREPFGHRLPVLKEFFLNGQTVVTAVISGSLRRYSVQGLVEASATEVAIPTYRVKARGVKIRLPFSMALSNFRTTPSRIDLNVPIDGRAHVDWIQWKSHEWRNVSVPIAFLQDTLVMGSMKLPIWGGAVVLEGAKIQNPLSPLPRVSMGLSLRDIHLEEETLGPLLPATMLNWKLSGAMDFDLAIGARTAQAMERQFGIQLKNLSFSSPDETKLGEGIEGEILVNLSLPLHKNEPASFHGDLNLDAGEILLGSFYINLRQDPLRLRPEGIYHPQSRRFSSLSIHFQAPTLGEGTITGSLESLDDPRGEVEVTLGPIANKRAFDLFVKEPFGHVSPMVKRLSITGETLITASIRGSLRRYSIHGLIETSGMDLVIPNHHLEAKGIKIQFPVALDHPSGDSTDSGTGLNNPLTGVIQADWIRWRSQEWRDLALPMTLEENTLFFPHQMKLPIWGGAVILEEARIRNPFQKTREITLGLKLERLDFSKITNLFLPFALPGSLAGNFSEISVSEDSLETHGNLAVHALGGEVEVRNIRGSTPFSRLRKVSLDVFFKDIDLEEASRSFEFGQMGGIIEGEMRGFALSFGQPESFELEIRSVKKRGIKQYVNAEVVNNLSILSTGSGFSFKKGALQFLKYYPYAKLGIYCKLQNDVFNLRGTIHRKGVEYLIKRGLVGGIDVINQNPENRIRWRQMLRRLEAIRRGRGDVEISTQK